MEKVVHICDRCNHEEVYDKIGDSKFRMDMEKFLDTIDEVARRHEPKMTQVITEMIEDLITEFYKNNIPVRQFLCEECCDYQDSTEFIMALNRLRARHLELNFEMVALINDFDELIQRLENRKLTTSSPITGDAAKKLLYKLKNPVDNSAVLNKCKELKQNFEEK